MHVSVASIDGRKRIDLINKFLWVGAGLAPSIDKERKKKALKNAGMKKKILYSNQLKINDRKIIIIIV